MLVKYKVIWRLPFGICVVLLAVTLASQCVTIYEVSEFHNKYNRATHMIISHNYREKGKNKLYNTQDKTELEQLIHLIDFKTTPLRYRLLQESANCRCGGDMTFEFYKGRDLIGRFTFHHWMTIRERKDKDLTNESQKRIRNWLKTKGITKEILSSNGVKGSVENWLKQKKVPEEMLDPERLEELLKQEGFTE